MRLQLHGHPGERVLQEQAPEIAAALHEHATRIAGRIRPPASADLTTFAFAGVGPRGPYAQAGMRGPGAIAIEFGTRTSPPQASVRRGLGGS